MIKTFSALALAACVAAAVTALAPKVEASVPRALAKGDRLDLHPAGHDCSQQTWPNFEPACLRTAGIRGPVRVARLVTADRTP